MAVSEEKIMAELTDIFRDILFNDNLELKRDTLMQDIENWDSLANVRIMIATERVFGVRFEIDELMSVDGVAVLIDLLHRKLN